MELQDAYDKLDGEEFTIGDVGYSDLAGSDVGFEYNVYVDDAESLVEALGLTEKIEQLEENEDPYDVVEDAIDNWDVSERLPGVSLVMQ